MRKHGEMTLTEKSRERQSWRGGHRSGEGKIQMYKRVTLESDCPVLLLSKAWGLQEGFKEPQ